MRVLLVYTSYRISENSEFKISMDLNDHPCTPSLPWQPYFFLHFYPLSTKRSTKQESSWELQGEIKLIPATVWKTNSLFHQWNCGMSQACPDWEAPLNHNLCLHQQRSNPKESCSVMVWAGEKCDKHQSSPSLPTPWPCTSYSLPHATIIVMLNVCWKKNGINKQTKKVL